MRVKKNVMMLQGDSLRTYVPLSEFSTFGIGGPARYLAVATSKEELQSLLQYCYNEDLPFFILGKGSNCLFDDRGFNGLVILNKISFYSESQGVVTVGAGYSFSLLGRQTAKSGWAGLEFASGIPGSVGGAIYMNAGANGQETWQTLESIEYIEADGEKQHFTKSDLSYGYRSTAFQHMHGAIVSAVFRLSPGDGARERQLDIIKYRTDTQPYSDKSCGCVFRNPGEGLSAGALIEQCGLKGASCGGAQVSPKHANFLVNTGAATASDVLALIDVVKDKVLNERGIKLHTEIIYVPYEAS